MLQPLLQKSVFLVNHKPNIGFYDLMFSTAQKFDSIFPHWRTDRIKLTLFDPIKHFSLTTGFDFFAYAQDRASIENEQEQIKQALEVLPEALNIAGVKRFGLRRFYLTQVNMDFESLVAILNVKLLSQDEKLHKILPFSPIDLSYILITSDGTYTCRTVIGPLHKAEIPTYINIDKDHHLDVKTKEEQYIEILKGYPDVSVLTDIDFSCEGTDINIKDANEFVQIGNKTITKLVNELNSYLFSTNIGEK